MSCSSDIQICWFSQAYWCQNQPVQIFVVLIPLQPDAESLQWLVGYRMTLVNPTTTHGGTTLSVHIPGSTLITKYLAQH